MCRFLTHYALILFTGALVVVAYLQWGTTVSQEAIQRAATKSNIAPSYGGKSDSGWLVLRMENTGEIPARDVTVFRASAVMPSSHDLSDLCSGAKPEGNPVTIHPGAEIEHHIAPPELSEDESLDGVYYVCGWIEYWDDLDRPPSSDCCFSLDNVELGSDGDNHTMCAVPKREPRP